MVMISGTEEEYKKHRNENLRNYQNEFVPLIKHGEYDKAFSYLLENPEVEQEVKGSEWREMCRYFACKNQLSGCTNREFENSSNDYDLR